MSENDITVDTDGIVLDDAASAVGRLDLTYRRAVRKPDPRAVLKLRPRVKAAFEAYSKARLELMKKGTLTGDEHIAEMRRIRAEIDQAAETESLVRGAVKLVAFLRGFV